MRSSQKYVFTSESVSDGHPDKVCDQISDSVLDYLIAREPEARGAIETFVSTNFVLLGGEYRVHFALQADEIEALVRSVVRDIGYEQDGFHWRNLQFDNRLHQQSQDIISGVDATEDRAEGAGDQGIMFGYANNDTEVYLPATIYYAHKLLRRLRDKRRAQPELGLLPDAKSQISLAFVDGKPEYATTVVLSTQHQADVPLSRVEELIENHIRETLPRGWVTDATRILVNPTGRFVIGGPDGDAGLTGRKIIVDTYGGFAPHGGGAFSGKDPTKVDRSASYALRYIAKNIVAAGLAQECLIQIAYAIGRAEPLALYVNTFGTSVLSDDRILERVIQDICDLTPKGIRQLLRLNRPIYRRTATFGHFGRVSDAHSSDEDADDFTWERLDLVNALRAEVRQHA